MFEREEVTGFGDASGAPARVARIVGSGDHRCDYWFPSGADWLAWGTYSSQDDLLHSKCLFVDAEGVGLVLVGTGAVGAEREVNWPSTAQGRPSFLTMLGQIRSRLGLNISQLAEVVRVARPTIYAWLAESSEPQQANRERVHALWEAALSWPATDRQPGVDVWDSEATADGYSLWELMTAEQFRSFPITQALRTLGSNEDRPQVHTWPSKRHAGEHVDYMLGRGFASDVS